MKGGTDMIEYSPFWNTLNNSTESTNDNSSSDDDVIDAEYTKE